MPITSRILLVPTAALAILLGGAGMAAMTPSPGVGTPTPQYSASTMVATGAQCEEDEPCWDCETMGNRQCGVTEADRAMAWAAWDKWQGWRTLAADPTREFKVDVVAYSLQQPATDRSRPAFQGEDGRWFLFTADYLDTH